MQVQEIRALETTCPKYMTLFLVGSTTGADWQRRAVTLLDGPISVYNPRRLGFNVNDEEDRRRQHNWEVERLGWSDGLLLWFSEAELAPSLWPMIHRWSAVDNRPMWLGVAPEQPRREQIIEQAGEEIPDSPVFDGLDRLCFEVSTKYKEWSLRFTE